MSPSNDLPMPFVSAWDPRATASGSIDPMGALRAFTSMATTLLPGVTTITTRARYLSWVCAGLRLLDEVADAPEGGRAGRARRQRILAWERLVALATGTYAMVVGLDEGDPAWRQLRGVSYVRRAAADGVRSPDFAMLRNQAGIGGVGTYWVTLVAGGLVEAESGKLTPNGNALADAFLRHRTTPSRPRLHKVVRGQAVTFTEAELVEWGRHTHLGAMTARERSIIADALLEPAAHRWIASAMATTGAAASDRSDFRLLASHLQRQSEPLAMRLAAVISVAGAFEDVHRELLYRFDQVRALGYRRPVPLKDIAITTGADLAHLADKLTAELSTHGASLPHSVSEAIHSFSLAVEPAVRARTNAQFLRALISHHERVQVGKLDVSRQPKLPWVELRGSDLVIAPRFALEARPLTPSGDRFTHPYRIEQFGGLLGEADARAETP